MLVSGLAGGAVLASTGHVAAAASLTAASGVGAVVVGWASTVERFGTRSAGGNFGLVFTGWSTGLLLGALGAATAAGGVVTTWTAGAARIPIAVAFALVLGMAVLIAARIRPTMTVAAEDGDRGNQRGGAKG